ncbi:uncharacterized protein V6R79_003440 [Siganus canaliculatus]
MRALRGGGGGGGGRGPLPASTHPSHLTGPNGKHHIMTAIDPVAGSCPRRGPPPSSVRVPAPPCHSPNLKIHIKTLNEAWRNNSLHKLPVA